MSSNQDFPLPPLPRSVWVWLVLPAVAVVAGLWLMPSPQRTPISHLWLTPLLVALAMLVPLLALRRRRIHIEGRDLVVAATFYTRRMPVDALDLDRARVVDLAEHTEYAPMLGINRFGVPGLRAGHYLLRNRARAFCLLVGRGRTLVLPQRDGKYLLLRPDKSQPLLDRLRELARSPVRR